MRTMQTFFKLLLFKPFFLSGYCTMWKTLPLRGSWRGLLLLLVLLLPGCRTEPKDFTLSFSMESIDIYKFSIEISADKSYRIQQQNLYLDTQEIETARGLMTDEKFAELTKLIAGSRLFKLKDSYGFDKEPDELDPFSNVIYQLHYTEGRKVKNITMRPNATDLFPKKFLELIQFLIRLNAKT